MSNLENLINLIRESTIVYRKGEVVVERDVAGIHVTEVFGYPPAPADTSDLVDVHFVLVGASPSIGSRADFLAALTAYQYQDRLAGGPSYIEIGAVLGDQETALRLIALGEIHKVWKVVTPKTLHVEGPEADQLAGRGMVMPAGYRVDEIDA